MHENVNRHLGKVHRKSRMQLGAAIRLIYFLPLIAYGYVTESEPNDTRATADSIQCGDTVYCATLSPMSDLDHFRFFTHINDSVIAKTFSCDGSLTNTILVLYNDEDSVLAVDDNNGPAEFSLIRYRASFTGNYTLRVMRLANSVDSTYSMVLNCPAGVPEDFDHCDSPRIIPSLPYYDEASTLGQTSQCGTAAADVFYQLNLPARANIFISVCTNNWDARVQVMGRCCRDFWDDSNTGCGLGADLVSYGLNPADYSIMVEGTSVTESGPFSIEIEAVLPECPAPEPLVLGSVGGYPLLDWPEQSGPNYYIVWHSYSMDGPFEHLGVAFQTFYVDSTGYANQRQFYKVTSVCPWQ